MALAGAAEGDVRRIVAVLPADFPPISFVEGGRPTGFAVDLLDRVAKQAGIEVAYVLGKPWDEIHQMVLDRRADCIPCLVVSPERQKKFIFTRSIDEVTINVVVRSEMTGILHLQSGMRVGVTSGSSGDELVGKRTDLAISRFSSQPQLLVELLAGRLDAVVTSRSSLSKLAYDAGLEDRIRFLQPSLSESIRAIAFRPEDAALCRLMDEALAKVIATPEFDTIYRRWWGGSRSWWTTGRVIVIVAVLLAVVIAVMVAWRFQSLRLAHRAISASEENLRITLESIGDAVIAMDAAGRITRMNRMAEALTGWSQAEAQGQCLPMVYRIVNKADHGPCASPVDRVLATGQVVEISHPIELIGRHGARHQIADSGSPIRNDTGAIVGVVLVFRDVSKEQALQAQLQQSQKMEAIGQLAGGIAHDFNNMLAGVLGGADLLRIRVGQDAMNARYLGMIIDSANRAADLTRKLLQFARKQTAASTPVDVHAALNDTIAILRDTMDRRIKIEADLSASDSRVIGDLAQLQSVFLNLGINASHAMPQGGTLIFRSRVRVLERDEFQAIGPPLHAGPFIEIEVQDTGCGIPPDILPRIFEPFFTTKGKDKGTGLGLSASLGTIQQHRGAIRVHSEVGHGACFQVLLPLTGMTVVVTPPPSLPVHGHGRILLVEDEAVLRSIGAVMLTGLGYDVITAVNGSEAVQIFSQERGSIDLVIIDMVMPVMNGRECFIELRRMRPDLPIILASGFSQEEDVQDLRRQGLSGFIEKPFKTADLSRMIAASLHSQGAGPAIGARIEDVSSNG